MDVAERIHEANERFKQAIRAADSSTMPSLYTSDAKILPPNGDAVGDSDSIAEFWQGFFTLGITEARPVTLEVIPMGEYALEVGEYSVFSEDGALVDRGKTMVLWKNDGGTWKMHRDTWNSSIPV
jgi:ketosteroid isomerase-like protein